MVLYESEQHAAIRICSVIIDNNLCPKNLQSRNRSPSPVDLVCLKNVQEVIGTRVCSYGYSVQKHAKRGR